VLVWADFQQRGQVEVSLEFKRRVFHALSKYPNARIHDFQAEPVIFDLAEYADIYHYSPRVSSNLVTKLSRGDNRVTAENLEAGLAAQAAIAREADPARIIATARN